MATQRRKFKLSNAKYRNTNLKNFEQIIIDTVNQTVPDKNPKVFENYFSTDILSHSEAVSIGRALAKIDQLNVLGQEKTIFRLFDGKTYDSEEATTPSIPKIIPKGGKKK